MTWEQKLMALKALAGHWKCPLQMRKPGDWYVGGLIEIGGDGMLKSPTCSEAAPEAAVNRMWQIYTEELPPNRYLVIDALGEIKRRHVRWNGYMWEDLPVE